MQKLSGQPTLFPRHLVRIPMPEMVGEVAAYENPAGFASRRDRTGVVRVGVGGFGRSTSLPLSDSSPVPLPPVGSGLVGGVYIPRSDGSRLAVGIPSLPGPCGRESSKVAEVNGGCAAVVGYHTRAYHLGVVAPGRGRESRDAIKTSDAVRWM